MLRGFRLLAQGFALIFSGFHLPHTHRYSTDAYPPACVHCGATITRPW